VTVSCECGNEPTEDKDNKFFINVDKYQKTKVFIFSAIKTSDLSSFIYTEYEWALTRFYPYSLYTNEGSQVVTVANKKWGSTMRNFALAYSYGLR